MKQAAKKIALLLAVILLVSACGQAPEKKSEQSTQTAKTEEAKQEEGKENDKTAENVDGEVKNKGVTAPDFELTDMSGNVVKMSDFKGKKVYLKFWASWCHVCLQHMPELEELVAMEDKEFEVYTIVADKNNGEKSMEDFKKWYESKGYSDKINVLFDNSDSNLMAKYGIRAFPTNAFIGSDGVLVGVAMGAAGNKQIIEFMKTIH